MTKIKEYFEGKVRSLGNEIEGKSFTIGIIDSGEYTFSTETREHIEVIYGKVEVIHPDNRRRNYKKGESFTIPTNSEFTTITTAPVAYLCLYQ
jgi:uncharacterized protein YaiE (UPF0345 family)